MTGTTVVEGTIVVWFSCGAASAVAAKVALDMYRTKENCIVRVVNNPVAEEDEDNRRFLKDVESWLDIEVEVATNPKFPSTSAVEVWDKRKFMSGPHGAPCTLLLKKEARYHWERTNQADWHVLGFTSEEKKRSERFMLTEKSNLLPLLVNCGITKDDCYKIIIDAGLQLPRVYKMGYPNANCIGCVKATSPTYWNHVRAKHPSIFDERAKQSRKLGAKLARYEGSRIFLDELPVNAKGRSMKTLNVDCGIFCEEGRENEH
jgi:hypothetical protein